MNMRDEILAYLSKTERSREWLADQLGYSKRTVDNWLGVNGDPIPLPAQKLFRVLQNELFHTTVGFSAEEFQKITQAMAATKFTDPVEFLIEASKAETQDVLSGRATMKSKSTQATKKSILEIVSARPDLARAAEDSPEESIHADRLTDDEAPYEVSSPTQKLEEVAQTKKKAALKKKKAGLEHIATANKIVTGRDEAPA